MSDLVDRIRELAKLKNVSLTILEEHLGFGNGTIGKWKKQDPSSKKLLLVADYLNVTIDYLLKGDSINQQVTTGNINNSGAMGIHNHAPITIKNGIERELTKQEQDLLRIYNTVDGKKQMEIMKLIYDIESTHNTSY